MVSSFFFFNDTATTEIYTLSLHDALPISGLMAIILVYGLVVARGLRTALQCREPFGKLLAAGLSFAFALQVFTIIGGGDRERTRLKSRHANISYAVFCLKKKTAYTTTHIS